MNIRLSDHFTYGKLLKFTLMSILMMIFTSIYGVVDGYFVSNYVGKTAFTAVNFIMPFLMILGAVGFMFGTGGSALIAKTMGEGDDEKAKKLFSLIIYVSIACGVLLSLFGLVFIKPIAGLLGAEGQMLDGCIRYGRIILMAVPAYMLQYEFQSLFVTAGKPQLGLLVTVAAGVTNMVLDALFVAVFKFGLEGAAVATAVSECVGGIIPLIYFGRKNSSLLHLTKTHFDGRALLKTCSNGMSELLSNISMSIVSMLYNAQLIRYAGEDGVAAYGVLMYVNMIFVAVFIGYSVGMAPVVGYHYGAQNHGELHNLLRKSLVIICTCAAAMLVISELAAKPLSLVFVGYDAGLLEMTLHAFKIYSFAFLFAGFAIFGSGFFTALNDGVTSAVISFLRTVVFQVAAVLIFPLIWDIDGIWMSIAAAEFMAAAVALTLIAVKRRKYNY